MVTVQLTEGTHTIKWTLSGYGTLEAKISVSSSGVVTCTSVTGGSCGSTTPPGVKISGSLSAGYIITGYLESGGESGICAWITGIGGWDKITAYDIMSLVSAYSGQKDLGFSVSSAYIMGAVSYYSNKGGSPSSGNSLTGCNF